MYHFNALFKLKCLMQRIPNKVWEHLACRLLIIPHRGYEDPGWDNRSCDQIKRNLNLNFGQTQPINICSHHKLIFNVYSLLTFLVILHVSAIEFGQLTCPIWSSFFGHLNNPHIYLHIKSRLFRRDPERLFSLRTQTQ